MNDYDRDLLMRMVTKYKRAKTVYENERPGTDREYRAMETMEALVERAEAKGSEFCDEFIKVVTA
jgi:hypothetical protein